MKSFIIILFLSAAAANAQQHSSAIEDNSFFIEEAYNQEEGVIQHIFNGISSPDNNFEFLFTEEIPVTSQLHQFSFSVDYLSFNSGELKGVGDLMLNYRYQFTGKESWAAVSPRISLIIPKGERNNGLGADKVGYAFNLPVSKRLSEYFTLHFNAGMTLFPEINELVDTEIIFGSHTEYHTGASIIWLVSSKLNFLLEYLVNYSSSLNADGSSSFNDEQIIAPGIRYAIDIVDLQIVPGFAAAFISSNNSIDEHYFFYLSFEHPF